MNKNNFLNSFSNKAMKVASQFGNQKHLTVIRDSFALLTPLIIAGAIGILLRTFIFGGMGAAQTSVLGWIAKSQGQIIIDEVTGSWSFVKDSSFAQASLIGDSIFKSLGSATIDLMSLYISFGIGYFLSNIRKSKDTIFAGLVSLLAFLMVTLGKPTLLSANGLLAAIIVGVFATEIYVMLEKSERLKLKLPAGVPPAVSRSFSKLFPVIIVSLIVAFLNAPFVIWGVFTEAAPASTPTGGGSSFTFADAIYHGIQAPFMSIVGQNSFSLALGVVWAFGMSIIWFFGIHGVTVLMGIFSPIFYALYYENVEGADHVFVQGTTSVFIQIGGSGATLALIVAIFIFSKDKASRELAKIGTGPGIFNINEPIIFGLPIVLNVRYAIPFIFVSPILAVTTWIGFTYMNIHPVTILVPWNTPIGIGGLLATALDYKGFLLAIFNFLVAFVIYLPFVLIGQKKLKEKVVKKGEKNETKSISAK